MRTRPSLICGESRATGDRGQAPWALGPLLYHSMRRPEQLAPPGWLNHSDLCLEQSHVGQVRVSEARPVSGRRIRRQLQRYCGAFCLVLAGSHLERESSLGCDVDLVGILAVSAKHTQSAGRRTGQGAYAASGSHTWPTLGRSGNKAIQECVLR